jgi:hypothetical protein
VKTLGAFIMPKNKSGGFAMDNIERIKDSITAKDVAILYGLKITNNKTNCFLHKDNTPSMSFKDSRFKCFSCGIGGSCIDLCMNLFSLSFTNACKKLNDDYRLGLNFGRLSPYEIKENFKLQKQHNIDKKIVEQFNKWENETFITLCSYLKLLEQYKKEYAPMNKDSPLNELYVLSLNKLDYLEYLTDVFIFGPFEEKARLKEDIEGLVNTIERSIRESKAVA